MGLTLRVYPDFLHQLTYSLGRSKYLDGRKILYRWLHFPAQRVMRRPFVLHLGRARVFFVDRARSSKGMNPCEPYFLLSLPNDYCSLLWDFRRSIRS